MGRIQVEDDLGQTQPANFPPETQPANFPPETQPENYPYDDQSQEGPENYPPQSNNPEAPPTSENNSNQTALPKQPPVQFPAPQHNINGHPPQATSQVHPHATSHVHPQANSQLHPHAPPSPYKSVPQQNNTKPVFSVLQSNLTAAMQTASSDTNVGTNDWSTGLFDCMQDPANALITCFLPCVTFGQIAEVIDNGGTSCLTSGLIYLGIACLIGCPCLLSCTYRSKLRSKFALMETPAPDWLIHCCCEHCALCQEYRELQSRGLDPSSGWTEYMSKDQNMQQQVVTAAPMNQTMMG